MQAGKDQKAPWNDPWPESGLEPVPCCPVCGTSESEVVHAGLVDNAFFVSPGKWTLWRCLGCGSAYLNPRPDQETLHMAYASYYTHNKPAGTAGYDDLGLLRRLRRRLANGYINWRFGGDQQPASGLGIPAAYVLPNMRRVIDSRYRHLPRLPETGGRLLDVGCGDGSFLKLAKDIGWNVVGVDPDPEAARNASSQGLTVYEGGVDYFAGESELFDVITLNHVIEHVPDPVRVLADCHALLKPGGRIWVETPNVDSHGHARFGRNWRGLEAPRHLLLFNRRSLREAVTAAGFVMPAECLRPSAAPGIYKASYAMEVGSSPYAPPPLPWHLKLASRMASCLEMFRPAHREFLTLAATKAE